MRSGNDALLSPAGTPPVRKRRRWPWIVVASLLAVLLTGGGIAAVYVWNLAKTYGDSVTTLPTGETFPRAEVRPAASESEASNILLLGSDIRGDVGTDLDSIRGQRADTIMVVHIPADGKSLQVMSIMRDNWVSIPGHGDAKINAALSFGGVPLMVQTIEELIGSRIDHVAIIDFRGFRGLTHALGGITVDNAVAFSTGDSRFEQGPITLSGASALAYVRERYAFADGDYQRVRNQQAFIKGIIDKLLSTDTLTDPGKITATVAAIGPYMTVDAGLDATTVGALAVKLRDVRPGDVSFFTTPTLGTGTSADGQSIVIPDRDGLAQVAEAFRTDTVGEYVAGRSAG